MDMQAVISAIGSLGFPIAGCLGLFWMINKALKELTSAIDNNTKAIIILTERSNNHDQTGD